MSTSKIDDEGFRFVSSKHSSRRKRSNRIVQKHNLNLQDLAIDKEVALRRINAAKEDLQNSDYLKSLLATLQESLSTFENRNVVEVLSYGLGHIGECMVSRYQLALLLCLKDTYKSKCLTHDPIFYKDECDILKSLSIEIIKENEEGKRDLVSNGITIVYMPHCPKQLVNNLLWKNWNRNLLNCVLICNSFISLVESQPHRLLNESVPFILNVYPYVNEFSLVNSFKYNDIFNDLSIHIFPDSRLSSVTDNFWVSGEEPTYSDTVELISRDIVQKLNIV